MVTNQVSGEAAAIRPEIFDERECSLGEGPLWHPQRETLYWVDILSRRLLGKGPDGVQAWELGEMPTAIGWVDRERLLVACESGLNLFDVESGQKQLLCTLEPDIPSNRSNDGRADPWGGFWIGTMSKNGEAGCGNLYRWYRGTLRKLVEGLSVPNGLCFDRRRNLGYYADSAENLIYRLALDPDTGWPSGAPEIFLDFREQGMIPDGAVLDVDGGLWTSLWDGARTVCYGPDGKERGALFAATPRTTCPAFGGPDYTDLYVTTAAVGVENAADTPTPAGVTLVFKNAVKGRPEPAVVLEGA
ncbi:hypothetical protein A3224_10195 [Microbulbifer thermotolerans]|uniref:SMP-30/Gluconolactonase/LRE-like region domain-containing protein n=1 Tax=Microbulbifer thermotolerans TaxID=252514 RepID=A0A143HRR7_MICTH|nr:hypothetical protein A3224_10195 [Microbulbifer thermotolerans]